jgi:hypothetical protein
LLPRLARSAGASSSGSVSHSRFATANASPRLAWYVQ